jgi:hypothetical protein
VADKSKAKAKVEDVVDAKNAEAQELQAEVQELESVDPHEEAEQKQAEASVAQAEANRLEQAVTPMNDIEALKRHSEIVAKQEAEVQERLDKVARDENAS